jgi:hypothetical protein
MLSVVFLHKDLMKTSAKNREDHGPARYRAARERISSETLLPLIRTSF